MGAPKIQALHVGEQAAHMQVGQRQGMFLGHDGQPVAEPGESGPVTDIGAHAGDMRVPFLERGDDLDQPLKRVHERQHARGVPVAGGVAFHNRTATDLDIPETEPVHLLEMAFEEGIAERFRGETGRKIRRGGRAGRVQGHPSQVFGAVAADAQGMVEALEPEALFDGFAHGIGLERFQHPRQKDVRRVEPVTLFEHFEVAGTRAALFRALQFHIGQLRQGGSGEEVLPEPLLLAKVQFRRGIVKRVFARAALEHTHADVDGKHGMAAARREPRSRIILKREVAPVAHDEIAGEVHAEKHAAGLRPQKHHRVIHAAVVDMGRVFRVDRVFHHRDLPQERLLGESVKHHVLAHEMLAPEQHVRNLGLQPSAIEFRHQRGHVAGSLGLHAAHPAFEGR